MGTSGQQHFVQDKPCLCASAWQMMAQQAVKFARRSTAITAQQMHQRDTVHHVLRIFNRLLYSIFGTFGDLQTMEQLRKWLHSAVNSKQQPDSCAAQTMPKSSQSAGLHRQCDTTPCSCTAQSMAASTVCAAPSKRSPAGPHQCWLCSDPLLQLSVQQARPPPAGVPISASIARYQAPYHPQRCPCLLLVASLCKLSAVGDVKDFV